MKLIKAAVALLALSVSSTGVVSAESVLKEILESGTLKVGTTGDFNPMSVRDPATNSYKGYDIDVMQELAKDMGVEVEFVATDWKTLVNGVVAGKYHLTGSASISPARMKAAGFSESYLSVQILPFTTEDKVDRFDGWDSINKPDVKVATTLGTTLEKHTRAWFPDAKITAMEAPARGYQDVLTGRSDVFVTSNLEGATLTEKHKNLRPVAVDAPRAPAALAMLLPQDDQIWINYVNNWVKIKKLGGFFSATAAKWGLAE